MVVSHAAERQTVVKNAFEMCGIAALPSSNFSHPAEAFSMTECTQDTFFFTARFPHRVETGFSGGQISSDGGQLCCARRISRSVCWSGWQLLHRQAGYPLDPASTAGATHLRAGSGFEDLCDHEQLRPVVAFTAVQQSAEEGRHICHSAAQRRISPSLHLGLKQKGSRQSGCLP